MGRENPYVLATRTASSAAAGSQRALRINGYDELYTRATIGGCGLPTFGVDAAGADAYATVVTAPARECNYALVSVSTKGAIVSFDGGTTDHIAIPADTTWLFQGLAIASAAVVQGKNMDAGQNYANLRISVW